MNAIERAQIKAMMIFAMKERLGDLQDHYETIGDLEDCLEASLETVTRQYTVSNLLSDDFELAYEAENGHFYEASEAPTDPADI